MTKTKKIVLAIAAVVIVGLLIYVATSGGALGTVKCQDCDGTGLVDGAPCETCSAECETCEAHGAIDGALCEDCHGYGRIAGDGTVQGSAWALLPPVIAIALALITKEVYSTSTSSRRWTRSPPTV